MDLSCLGTQGQRPIHWACRRGHAAIVQVLLKVRPKCHPKSHLDLVLYWFDHLFKEMLVLEIDKKKFLHKKCLRS